MKIKFFVILLVLLLGCAAVYSAITFVPEIAVIHSMHNVWDDFSERSEIKPIQNVLTKGSLETSFSKLEQDGNPLVENVSVSGKMYFSKKAFLLQDLDICVDDTKIHGSVYASNDLLYVSEDHFLGGAYGIVPETFTTDLRDSIFAADSGSKYAIPDEEFYNMLMESSDPIAFENMKKDAKKILKKYEIQLWRIVCDHAEITSVSKYVNFDEWDRSVRVLTIEMEPRELAAIIEEFYEYIEDDSAVVEFLEKYESLLLPSIEYVYGDIEKNSLADAYEKLLDDAEDSVDEVCDNLKATKDGLLEIEIATPKFSTKMLKMTVKLYSQEMFSINFSEKGVKRADKIAINAFDSKIVYRVENKYDTKTVTTLTVDEKDVLAITVNRARETFQLNTEDFSVSGKMQTEDEKTVLAVEKISFYDTNATNEKTVTEEYTTDLQIVIRQKDKMPEAPTVYKKISEITEDEVDGWLKKMKLDEEDASA